MKQNTDIYKNSTPWCLDTALINKYVIYIPYSCSLFITFSGGRVSYSSLDPLRKTPILLLEGFLPDLLERKFATIYLFLGDNKISCVVYFINSTDLMGNANSNIANAICDFLIQRFSQGHTLHKSRCN